MKAVAVMVMTMVEEANKAIVSTVLASGSGGTTGIEK